MKRLLLSIALLISGICCALDWQEFRRDPGTSRFRGPSKSQIDVYSSAKRSGNFSAAIRKDHLEVKISELAPGEYIKIRFHLFREIQYPGKQMTLQVSASAPGKKPVDFLLDGKIDPKLAKKIPDKKIRTHFWKKTSMPIPSEQASVKKNYHFPEGLFGLTLRLDLKETGVYRFYDVKLKKAESAIKELEPGRNYILNGGAERGFYGTAALMEDCAKMHDSGKFELNSRQHFTSLLQGKPDSSEAYSGKYSFRLHTPKGGLGNGVFYLNPVPFVVHEKAYLSFWAKGERKSTINCALFLANGIAYHRNFAVNTQWKRYEILIPSWGNPAPGISVYGDPAFGYSSTVPFCIPQFNVPPETTVWLDNVFYSVGVDRGDYAEKDVTSFIRTNRNNGIYRPGEPVEALLTVRNTSTQEQKVRVRRVLKDFLGREIPDTRRELELSLKPEETREIPDPFTPLKELRGAMNAVYDINGETTGLYFGVLEKPGALNPRLSVNIQEGNIDKTIEFMKEFRIGTARIWGGFRDWKYFGFRYAEPLHRAGIRSLYVVASPNKAKGLSFRADTLLPKDRSDWMNELASHVRKHRGEIAIYEFLNEYNIWRGRVKNPNPELLDDPTPEVYVKALADFRKMMKQNDPKALIAGPTPCGTDVSFILNILHLGGGRLLDMIAEHSYRQLPECPDYEEDLISLKKGAERYGKYRFAQTEAGAIKLPHLPDNIIEKNELKKASWDVRNMLIGWANGLDHYSHFMMSLIRTGCDWSVTHLGSGANGYHPLPSVELFACRAATDRIENGTCLKRLRLGTNCRGYLFDKGDSRVAVIWKWNGKGDRMQLSEFLKKHAVIHDFMGSRISASELELREFPFYFTTKASAEELERGILGSAREESTEPYLLETIPLNERNFAVQLTNQTVRNLSGFVQIGHEKRTFRNLPPEEKVRLAFHAGAPISLRPQTAKAAIQLEGMKKTELRDLTFRAIFVPRTSRTIIPDGNLSDWPAANRSVPLKVSSAGNNAEKSVRAEARLAWDEAYFYLAVTAWKRDHHPASNSGSLWRGDSIQAAFDTMRNASAGQIGYQDDDFEYDIALFHDKPTVYRSRSSASSYDSLGKPTGIVRDVHAGIRRYPDRIVYEIAFPKESVSPFRLNPESSMRFNVLLNIANEKGRIGYLQLTPGIGEKKAPSEFIDIILVK